eukprot:TRINITY_DN15867_c0_g1_i2.p1 TRINITY_DN15867_c0_g1~~TRINITY_DN15867_c0_g1_i2.p1  ORF type:complete len:348 (+),score=95.27 TRINITY_DN15867_c0_g1_i2:109-1044(+)
MGGAFADFFSAQGMDIESVSDNLADALQRHLENALHAVGGDTSKVYLVMDLDETMWTVRDPQDQGALGSAHWLAAITDEYSAHLPQYSYSDIQSQVLQMCDAVLGHIEVKPCDSEVVRVMSEWRSRGARVIAATARMNTMSRGTRMQRSYIGGLFFCDLQPDVPAVESRMRKMWDPHHGWPGLHHEEGIWYLSMGNKGLFLRALLNDDVACVFADDTRRHLMRSQEALSKVLPHHSCVHYTGAVEVAQRHFDQRQADATMAALVLRLFQKKDPHFTELLHSDNAFFTAWLHNAKAIVPGVEKILQSLPRRR